MDCNFFKDVLTTIERGLREGVNAELIADEFGISARHLQRLFKFVFNQPLGLYIRSRKLAASIDDLLNTDLNVLDIAMDYGFEYEQSYIRSFRREYGITPGDLRKTGQIVKITYPLQLFASNRYANELISEPDIVMVPKLHVIGKKYEIPICDNTTLVPRVINQFIINDRKHISNTIDPDLIINIATESSINSDSCFIMPSIQVKSLEDIPEGFTSYTFPSSLCVRFSFTNSDSKVLKKLPVKEMFTSIDNFMNENQKNIFERKVTIDKLRISDYGKYFKLWEWFSPVNRAAQTNTL